MQTPPTANRPTPLLIAALAGAGAGLLTGVLLAPAAGPALRHGLRGMAHKYGLLASEEEQQLDHHLAQRATRLDLAAKSLVRHAQGLLMKLGLMAPPARLPY